MELLSCLAEFKSHTLVFQFVAQPQVFFFVIGDPQGDRGGDGDEGVDSLR